MTSAAALGAIGRRSRMKGLKFISKARGLGQTREFVMGVTKVLKTVMAGGEDNYKFGSSGVEVKGYWTEDGTMRLDITGLAKREDASGQ